MADKDYKVFIVEGEAREPQIIDNISKIFFSHGTYTVITLPVGENTIIRMLLQQEHTIPILRNTILMHGRTL